MFVNYNDAIYDEVTGEHHAVEVYSPIWAQYHTPKFWSVEYEGCTLILLTQRQDCQTHHNHAVNQQPN